MTLLGHEREMLGLYVSDHPLMGLEHVLTAGADCTIGELIANEERPDTRPCTISGLVTSVQRKYTKRGDAWAMITVEDLEGSIDVLLFPSVYQLASTLLNEDVVVTVKGRLSRQKDQPELARHRGHVARPQRWARGPGGHHPALDPLHRAGRQPAQGRSRHPPGGHRGAAAAAGQDPTTVIKLDDKLRVSAGPALFADLKALLGPTVWRAADERSPPASRCCRGHCRPASAAACSAS